MTLDSSGRVGIGTSSPSANLDVNSAVNSTQAHFGTSSNRELIISSASSGGYDDALTKFTKNSSVGEFAFLNSGGERMRLDSSGRVGIGTSSPYANLHSVGTIKVATGNAQGILALGEGNGTAVNVGLWRGAANAPTTDGNFLNLGGYDGMVFATGAAAIGSQTERMRIDSSGDVGIGTSSPDVFSRGYTRTVGISSSGSTSLAIQSAGDPQYPAIEMGRGSSRQFLISNQAAYSTIGTLENSPLRFLINSTERMRLDASGNLLVGTTSSTPHTGTSTGVAIRNDGGVFFTRANADVLNVNRTTSDGAIAQFRKDGTVVGSIGTSSGVLYIDGPSGNGISLPNNGVLPATSGGARDNLTDLGASYARFKDLHLSGTANAANFNTTSDATLKTNVETLSGSLDAVTSLRGVSFDWLENGGSEIGVIAQEVEAVLPDVVSTNDEGIKSVKYGNMVAVLIEAIKEQQLRIEALEAKLGD
jgi:hypothetical protein